MNEYKIFIQVITNIVKILRSFQAVKQGRNSSLPVLEGTWTRGCGPRVAELSAEASGGFHQHSSSSLRCQPEAIYPLVWSV